MTKYVELLIGGMSDTHKTYLEMISLRYGIIQNRNTIVRNLDNTKIIGRVFDSMIQYIPPEILLNVFTHEQVMAYKNNPANGYIREEDLISEEE